MGNQLETSVCSLHCSQPNNTVGSKHKFNDPTTLLQDDENHDENIDIQPHVKFSVKRQTTKNLRAVSKLKCNEKDPCPLADKPQTPQKDNEKNIDQMLEQKQNSFTAIATQLQDLIPVKKQHIENNYRILQHLSKNKDSKIFYALHISNKQHRAIKQMSSQCPQSKINSKNLKIEGRCRIMSLLDHPNIMRLYQIYYFQQKIFLVLEYFEANLEKWSKKLDKKGKQRQKSNLIEAGLKTVLSQVLKALAYLHQKNIGHFGISTRSIMISAENTNSPKEIIAKLVGFGSSQILSHSYQLVPLPFSPQHNLQLQSRLFSAPQIKIQASIGLKTDIWDLGITFFKILTGSQINHEEYFRNSQKSILQYCRSSWAELKEKKQFLTDQCQQLVFSMLQNDLTFRPSAKQCLEHRWLKEQAAQNQKNLTDGLLKQSGKPRQNNFMKIISNAVIYQNIGQEQLHQIAEVFHKLDQDHSGFLQPQELLDYFKQTNQFENQDILITACQDIIARTDNDSSGTVDFHQFVKVVCHQKKYLNEENLKNFFQSIDWDGNGNIQINELKNILNKCEFEQICYYMEKIDSDASGTISQEEFLQYCEHKIGGFEKNTLNKTKLVPKKRKGTLFTVAKNHKTKKNNEKSSQRPKKSKNKVGFQNV